MATYDANTGEIVVRIVYDGLGTAGKTTNLRVLHAAFAQRAPGGLVVPEETSTGRTLYFDWLELIAGHLGPWPLRCQVISVPGQFAHAHRRFHLLHGVDGAVLVCDSTPRGVLAGRIAMGFLQRALVSSGNTAAPVVLQANKQDLDGALAPDEVARRMPSTPAAVVGAAAASGDGVRLTLLRTLDLVRGALRQHLADGGPTTLPLHLGSAAALHAALIGSDGDEVSDALRDALEASLSEVD